MFDASLHRLLARSGVAEPGAAVTDTHPLLFFAAGDRRRLGPRARRHFDACEQQRAIVYVPAAVVWECSHLARRGRIDIGHSARSFFDDLFSNTAFQLLELDAEQVYLADEARPNDDPFDALVCAAARKLGLPLLSRDEAITSSRLVTTLW